MRPLRTLNEFIVKLFVSHFVKELVKYANETGDVELTCEMKPSTADVIQQLHDVVGASFQIKGKTTMHDRPATWFLSLQDRTITLILD
mgnify:CR=1 FL=1